jgi:hypothetical protein
MPVSWLGVTSTGPVGSLAALRVGAAEVDSVGVVFSGLGRYMLCRAEESVAVASPPRPQDPRRDQRAASGEEADRQSDAHQGDQSGDDRVLLSLGLRHGAGASSRLGSRAGVRSFAIVAEAP